ncbi:hypothetical protein C6W88_02490 [Halomonas litopenaei]|uniref:Uncharacterized protein n=1 Tax=Halomonas litopenaei TaxID=2109328 RepID=A0ABX5J4I9_9GAMM|nr:hypothetical protein C6W89_02675 [Halomonas sp. SYSU XM8]PTL96271.1 hypothetical protein C6W88_02490 [Halomonas litopenaei]
MRKRSLRGVNEHFDPIFNAVLPSAGTFQTSPRAWRKSPCACRHCGPLGVSLSRPGVRPADIAR